MRALRPKTDASLAPPLPPPPLIIIFRYWISPSLLVLHAAAAAVLEAILAKNSIACREYFGRAWTLAEREFKSYIQGVLFLACPDTGTAKERV